MSLLQRLIAASGEIQLSSALGKWAEHTSTTVDSIVEIFGGGAGEVVAPAQFIQVIRLGSPQLVTGGGTPIVLNHIVAQQEIGAAQIGYSAGNGVFTLFPGRTYVMRAHGRFQNFSDATAGNLDVAWVNADTGFDLVSGTRSFHVPTTFIGDQNLSEHPVCELIYRATAEAHRVQLRCQAGDGSADLLPGQFTALITELR